VMGALVIAPFLIIWTTPGAWKLDRAIWTKMGLVFALLILAGIVAFWGPFVSSTGVSDYPLAFLTLPIIVSATFVAGRRGATAACLICSAMAISGTVQGLGPFFRGSVNESLLLLQSYLVVISVTATILAAVLKERNLAVDGIRRSQENLETRIAERTHDLTEALAQVKQLSGFLPICASCKKIRDDQGYWRQVEEYIRDHSEAEFSHSICPECAKKLYPGFCEDDPDESRK
jgi:hypothetical protein